LPHRDDLEADVRRGGHKQRSGDEPVGTGLCRQVDVGHLSGVDPFEGDRHRGGGVVRERSGGAVPLDEPVEVAVGIERRRAQQHPEEILRPAFWTVRCEQHRAGASDCAHAELVDCRRDLHPAADIP
jgi:hypothetical protein